MEKKIYTGLELFQLAYEDKLKDGQQFYLCITTQKMLEKNSNNPVIITYKDRNIVSSDNIPLTIAEYTYYTFEPIKMLDLDNPEEIMKELNKVGRTSVFINGDGFNVRLDSCSAKDPKNLCAKAGYETIKEALKFTILNLQKAESIKNYVTGKEYKWCSNRFLEIVKIPLR